MNQPRSSEDFLLSKVLLEFPVFSLNDDYMKCMAKVLYTKLDQIQNLIKQQSGFISSAIAEQEGIQV
jgi:hypothetical protein